ncbi:LuxR family transcriptional regulator [Sphingomonas sp. Leaf33]|uniref:helix-turn-helix domain-containing protein n=1 Tax=Sphingomonas sp. Leaf33 TaxID=1736215 RepID=UPI0006FD95F4|nr:DUF4019 domain-containing protein [Sphingomonas sp. Leaf33]KQN25156.1 LuxR family transcriptional regulator [Sphingomonas sp. Leaf33]
MSTRPTDELWALTEREKQTLRLIVRGHDAKSIARTLDLSVHTINERLRDARRKMAVPSSREAARLLFEAEGATPESLGDREIGADPAPAPVDQAAGPAWRRPAIIIGVMFMTLLLGLLALVAVPPATHAPASTEVVRTDVVRSAQTWLELLDQSKWDDSYRGTGAAFRKLNTLKMWSDASERVRKPLGAVVSRTLLSQENVPAPPDGYEVVKFRTRFANSGDVVETVSLEREGKTWRVVGVTVG